MNDFVPIRIRKNPAASNTHPHQKSVFYLWKLPIWTCELDPTQKVIRRTSRLCNLQNIHAPPRRDRECQNTCLYIPLVYVCRSVLPRGHWRMGLSKLEKIMFERTRRIGQAWTVLSYYTDQLMTPCSKYILGGSTLNGIPGGDRWARVLCGQIGWLSDHLRRVHVGCSEIGSTNEFENANSWKERKKSSPHPKHTTESTAARRPRPPRDGVQ